MRQRYAAAAGVLLLVTAGAVACGSAPDWRPASLPVPAGERAVVGDVTTCPGHWYAVGGVVDADGSTAPAAWTSRDGGHWTSIPVHPVSFYGRLAVFSAVACRGSQVVALGGAAGGAHGNPRTANWHGDAGGLDEVPVPFELYGGDAAVGVERMAAGPEGFLLTGERVSPRTGLAGAAVWTSRDGGTFTLVDADPALGSDASAATGAVDAVAVPDGWLVVGSVLPAHTRLAARDPGAWFSADGTRWRRETLVGSAADDEALERVVAWHGGALAVGVRGQRFGAWLRSGGGWRSAGRFGDFEGSALPAVSGLTPGRRAVYAAGGDGSRYRVWSSADGDSWHELKLPVTMTAGAGRRLLVAADGGKLLVAADDGAGVRMWLTPEPG